jgi:hypothetical protein
MPLYPQSATSQGTCPNSLLLCCFSSYTHIWVYQGGKKRITLTTQSYFMKPKLKVETKFNVKPKWNLISCTNKLDQKFLGFKALFTYTKTLYLAQHKNPNTINLAKWNKTQNMNFLANQIHHTTRMKFQNFKIGFWSQKFLFTPNMKKLKPHSH